MRDRVLRAYPEARVKVIPHLDLTSDSQITLSQSEAKRRLGYHAEDLIVGVMGFVAPSKRVDSLLQALKNLVSEFSNLCLVCVGQVVPGYDICSSVHHLGLADRVHMTGYVSLEEFQLYIQAIDVGVNLRYPTFGETSGALIRMMSAAKPVIVTNVGAFAEFPLHTVFRIPYGDHEIGSLTLALRQLLADQALRWQIGQAARTYIRTSCSPDVIARQYIDFIIETVRGDSPNVDPSPV
jgi:glycosyltransferase involved in cell wall biosynthesis